MSKSTDEFKQEVYNLVGEEYTVLGEYKNNKTKIKIRHNCNKCNNYEYDVAPNNFLAGRRCPKCAGQVKKSTDEFKQEVYNLVGEEYTVLGKYENNKKKIKIQHNCSKCNNFVWEVRPSGFLSDGNRCPECNSIDKRKSASEFKQEVYNLVGKEYTVLGEYETNDTKIKIRHNCNKCNNYEYDVAPIRFLNGTRCPKCANNIKQTTDGFKQEVYNLVGEEYTVLGEYENTNAKIKIRHNCDKCDNYEFEMAPNLFINRNQRCPICARHESESRAIKYMRGYLTERNIPFEGEKSYDGMNYINNLKIDIYVNSVNTEYDGMQHFKGWSADNDSKILIQTRDKAKNNFCLNENLNLVRIPYTEEKNLDNILDAIINYNEEELIKYNCLIIRDGKIINKPEIYNWYDME